MKHLNVWFGQLHLGELIQEDTGQLSFRYLPSYLEDRSAPAISVSLPKAEAPYGHQACLPFFDGLLPESLQRSAAAQSLGVSEGNTFAMLDRLGGEVAGALEFLPPDEVPKSAKASWVPVSLDDVSLMEILSELPVRPLLAGSRGLRLSLAGAQSKLPVCVVNGQVCLPSSEQPTTHILKPAMPKLSATTENEAFAMTLAAEVEGGLQRSRASVSSSRAVQLASRSWIWAKEFPRACRRLIATTWARWVRS
jgi:serine/threonine-protein kinase HipA